MTDTVVGLALTSVIVSIDNALLAGMILPFAARSHKKETMLVVGIALGFAQIIMAIGVDQLLANMFFRLIAILILFWMSIRTMIGIPAANRSHWEMSVIWKVFIYTAFGNLDNMIWLGSELKGQHVWLAIYSIATIPLFIMVAVFLSEQCEKHHWILIIGAGMMAFAAAGLIVDIPKWKLAEFYLVNPVPQILIGSCILAIGYGIRVLVNGRRVI